MSVFDAIVLGLVQGIAEFLPVSSSGHLILAREVLGLQVEHGLAVDAVLQLVTALAVVLYFRKDLWSLTVSAWCVVRGGKVERADKVMLGALILGTVPAVVAGLFLEELMDTTFRSATLVAWVLILGSMLFILAEYVQGRWAVYYSLDREDVRKASVNRLTLSKGILIGFFQALALVPGMSRSGATISGGMLLGLSREQSARFAFLLSVPIILGAGTKKLSELVIGEGVVSSEWHMIVLASLVAFASGIASIHYLLHYLKHHSLMIFVVYRVALAIIVLTFVI